MKFLFIFSFLPVVYSGLFGFGSKSTQNEPSTTINPAEQNLGDEISIFSDSTPDDLGAEISIPSNKHVAPKLLPKASSHPESHKPSVSTTHAPQTTKRFVIHDSHSDMCPQKVDAFTPGPWEQLLFDSFNVYQIINNRVTGKLHLHQAFPDGPTMVTSAVYDDTNEMLLLLNERDVYAYKKTDSSKKYELISSYPKTLPSTVKFAPNAALKWNDKRQILLSDDGHFALYDEYWNKSLMSGSTSDYFVGIPDHIRGINSWNHGKTTMYTSHQVFEYDMSTRAVTNNGHSLSQHFGC